MYRRRFFRGGSLLWLAICVVVPACWQAIVPGGLLAAQDSRPPNIVVIVGDDMGYADVGVHGSEQIPTPHLDRLATSGVRFTSGYVSGPYCSPARAGLLTGRYQTRFGHEFNPRGRQRGMPVSEVTLADRLGSAGYVTGMVGKWHLGTAPRFRPLRRGFDEFYGFLGGGHSYFPGQGAPIFRGTEPADEDEYLTDAFGREAVEFIGRSSDHPFFLYLTFNAVHTPMHATDDRLARFDSIADQRRRKYAAMMVAMDDAIGRVMAKLRDDDLLEETLVFFVNDNGGPTMRGTTVNAADNAPLRGSKRTLLEGGIRVQYFVSWPTHLPENTVLDDPVIQLDILPTALAAAGVDVRPEWQLDGVNLLPYLRGEQTGAPHEALYWRFGEQMAIRQGDWKLVRYDPQVEGKPGRATPAKLYNLREDIGEQHDLATKNSSKVAALQARWDDWNERNVPPLWSRPEGRLFETKAPAKQQAD